MVKKTAFWELGEKLSFAEKTKFSAENEFRVIWWTIARLLGEIPKSEQKETGAAQTEVSESSGYNRLHVQKMTRVGRLFAEFDADVVQVLMPSQAIAVAEKNITPTMDLIAFMIKSENDPEIGVRQFTREIEIGFEGAEDRKARRLEASLDNQAAFAKKLAEVPSSTIAELVSDVVTEFADEEAALASSEAVEEWTIAEQLKGMTDKTRTALKLVPKTIGDGNTESVRPNPAYEATQLTAEEYLESGHTPMERSASALAESDTVVAPLNVQLVEAVEQGKVKPLVSEEALAQYDAALAKIWDELKSAKSSAGIFKDTLVLLQVRTKVSMPRK